MKSAKAIFRISACLGFLIGGMNPPAKMSGETRYTYAGAVDPAAAVEAPGVPSVAEPSTTDELKLLKVQVALLQEQIEQLRSVVQEQSRLLGNVVSPGPRENPPVSGALLRPAMSPVSSSAQAIQQNVVKAEEVAKKADELSRNLGGFKFSGDFRYRLDVQARSGNDIAPPLQNIRGRYRVRLNVDKEIDPRFRFHLQLSTGPYNVGTTNDQDFAGTIAKHPFSIAEAYIHFQPNSHLALRGGRMEEVFADNMRFLWDDDVRFNGFQQVVTIPLETGFLGLSRVELRAGEYILSNPNVVILAPSTPFVAAGFQPGQKVRDSNLFHPGFVLRGSLSSQWAHQFLGDIAVYRNPNQIQLASTANGFPVLVSNALGLMLSGPMSAAGNATTTPGGAIFNARNFQIAHVGYRLERKGVKFGTREMPAWLDFQASRNVGSGKLRDAVMASANLGAIRGFGDVRFLYQFAIKDANALISQFSDDDLGTGTGVNIAVHAMRFDLGLTRFLQWQNLLFVQNERRTSNPAEQFFVSLQRGANPTFRYLGQLAFSF